MCISINRWSLFKEAVKKSFLLESYTTLLDKYMATACIGMLLLMYLRCLYGTIN
jgi:hypothetical protein